jgi:hypothetical protein
MSLVRSATVAVLALLVFISWGLPKQEFAKKEGKPCMFCHPAGKFKELTEAGKYYKEHNYSLEGYKASEASK